MPRKRKQVAQDYSEFDESYDESVLLNGSGTPPPIYRNSANARERARMRVLSRAFCRLKTKLPWVPPDTKLSKLDTLRLATKYIQQLKASLAGNVMDDDHHNLKRTPSLTWPFYLQQRELDLLPEHGECEDMTGIEPHWEKSAPHYADTGISASAKRDNERSTHMYHIHS